ncbi:unnamed protein product [Ceutorhynchus assimilis]|uniref:MOG interacting and ectopic P-granules protein 1 n=1 Tax=Ceutorhynchus assimilis TaxID=467358 RepID=A0A9P0DCL9_9CUCU|nr:unnamed protein product [Ceutorhynchus assimilis]
MAEVAAMGEVDEIHSNDESVMVNGEVTKETVDDVDMVDVEAKKLPTEEDEEMKSDGDKEEDTSLDSSSNKDATSQSNVDEDSKDSSEDSSQSSQEQIPENGEVANEDTNSSLAQNENSNVSSARNEDEEEEDSGSSSTSSDSKDENSQEGSDKKSPPAVEKNENEKMEISENGIEDPVESPATSNDDVQEIVKPHDTIELNSEDETDLQILDAKTNGSDEVIDLIDSPEKKTPPSKNLVKKDPITPRRSSRNLTKSKDGSKTNSKESGESDIEEVLPQDPLADNDQITVERVPMVKKPVPEQKASTIVVKDTKRLVEIANKTNQSSSGTGQTGKKEPTLVIIDTNSILSGRGPVPASMPVPSVKQSPATYANVLPMAVPAQGLYPANMRATITPIPASNQQHHKSAVQSAQASGAPLLPTLTDDMFVVEAPSFIVPYVYEKPPVKVLKEYIAEIKKQIEDNKKEEKAKKRAKKQEKKDKSKDDGEDASDDATSSSDEEIEEVKPDLKKPYSYFESPLGKFFTDIGCNLVQEYVQNDLLKQQKRKRDREQGSNIETNKTIATLVKTIEMSRSTNQHFKMDIKKCEFCNFKTESKLAMAYHLETPHMKNFVYKCNFCAYEVRSPHDILFHMEAEHAVRGHLERAPAFHQCPSCPFEDNQKGKLSRHLVVCARKFKPDRNLEPPPDWEPPAKIPRMPKMRATGLNAAVAAYQTLTNKGAQQYQFLSKMQLQQATATASTSALNRGRGRPTLGPNVKPSQPMIRPQGMIFKQQSGGQMLVPANYQLSGNQVYQTTTSQQQQQQTAKKPSNTPSISITPLPRTSSTATPAASKPGDTSSKNAFVICEICDGYIKDLEQLRNHMQWIHKIKIHPKMIYNRPPLNCQKCQFRFFTDQGLERHLLGSHGLVTSSMQDNANKSKDSGRCPVCGRVYQWKLLNHVARDHKMVLKPAHLSYKCTVCTATFGMYKQFENHVYSAHSVVAKRVMDKKTTSAAAGSTTKNATDMKPLKINDEITIIPQPAKSTNGKEAAKSTAVAGTSKTR